MLLNISIRFSFQFISSNYECLLCTQLKWWTANTQWEWLWLLPKEQVLIAKSLILIWTCCDKYCLRDIRTLYIFQLFDSHNILSWTTCEAQDSFSQQFWIVEQISILQSAAGLKRLGSAKALGVYSQRFSAPCDVYAAWSNHLASVPREEVGKPIEVYAQNQQIITSATPFCPQLDSRSVQIKEIGT